MGQIKILRKHYTENIKNELTESITEGYNKN